MPLASFVYFMQFRSTSEKYVQWYRARWPVDTNKTRATIADELFAWQKYLEMKKQFEPFITRLCRFDRISHRLEVIG